MHESRSAARDPRMELDDIAFRMSCGVYALGAIHDVMECGPSEPSGYVDALYGVYDYLYALVKDMDKNVALLSVRKEAQT